MRSIGFVVGSLCKRVCCGLKKVCSGLTTHKKSVSQSAKRFLFFKFFFENRRLNLSKSVLVIAQLAQGFTLCVLSVGL